MRVIKRAYKPRKINVAEISVDAAAQLLAGYSRSPNKFMQELIRRVTEGENNIDNDDFLNQVLSKIRMYKAAIG